MPRYCCAVHGVYFLQGVLDVLYTDLIMGLFVGHSASSRVVWVVPVNLS